MALSFNRYLGFSAIRNSDKRLVPAIKAFNTGLCFIIFGFILMIVGLVSIVFLFIAGLIQFSVGCALSVYSMIKINRIEAIIRNELNTNPAVFPNINYNTGFNINPQQTTIHYIVPPQTNSYQPQLNTYQSQPNLYQPQLYGYPTQQPNNIPNDLELPPPYIDEPVTHQSNAASGYQTNEHNLSSQKV